MNHKPFVIAEVPLTKTEYLRLTDHLSSRHTHTHRFVKRHTNGHLREKTINLGNHQNRHRLMAKLAQRRVYLEKIASFTQALLLAHEIEEQEEYQFDTDQLHQLKLITYPYVGYYLHLEGKPQNITNTLKHLKINQNPWLAHSPHLKRKLLSQDMHRKVEHFFADRHIIQNKYFKTLWNITHHNLYAEDVFMCVNFEINWFCNRRCSYCPVSKFKRVNQDKMPLSLFKKVVKELGRMNYTGYIHYNFYNETLLDKRLEKFIRTANKYCPTAKNHINSNGDLLTLEKFQKLIDAGVDFIFITLHDGELSKERKEFFIKAKQIKNIIDFELPQNMQFNNRGGLVDAGKGGSNNRPCYMPSYDAEITAAGHVLPCCNDYHEQMRMGNVKDTPLKEIWLNDKFTQFRRDLKRGLRHKYVICKDCNF